MLAIPSFFYTVLSYCCLGLQRCCAAWVVIGGCLWLADSGLGQVLDAPTKLRSETFWDNRDFDWYADNVPMFECPDPEITTTYYYRWDLLTKHLTYGSTNSGYSFTEFIDRPFWSGAYGAISCPAGHQIYEARWLRDPRVARDYARYWLRTPGAQPRNYSTWLADSIWASHQVHPNQAELIELLPDIIKNQEGWRARHFDSHVGLFWQTGHDDGMEFNINSRQSQDILRGAPSYRPSFNAYMWSDMLAIARIAELAGKPDIANDYKARAEKLMETMFDKMWDPKRQFFFPVLKNDEQRDGYTLKALTRTYESGRYAGDSHGRELIGYVPWQFGMLQGITQYDAAWKKLMQRDGFFADFGPSTVERNDPMFLLQKSCCWWSGQSWPYATTQTLKGLANHLQSGGNSLTNDDYLTLLQIYARSHRKDGKPYLAEALHPDTGSFEGHDGYNHSEHYFHSGYCDLVITGLVGVIPRSDDAIEIRPLAPSTWEYFALDRLRYREHDISVIWDKNGDRYRFGPGLHLLVDGKRVATAGTLQPLVALGVAPLPQSGESKTASRQKTRTNFAVNNDGTYYPRITASMTSANSSLSKINDGNYWYLQHPPNRWTCEGSSSASDWIEVDFGMEREIDTVKFFVLDDSDISESRIRAPERIQVERWVNGAWTMLEHERSGDRIAGHRPFILKFEPQRIGRLRVTLKHATGFVSGLTEIEAWGDAELPLAPLPNPPGNLAFNAGAAEYPKATASYHDRFGGVPASAIDGKTNFLASPTNRWTSYESPNERDWLEIDFGKETLFNRVELAIYDDRGGVQTPLKYELEIWRDGKWYSIDDVKRNPESPVGSQWNTASFPKQSTSKMRIQFTNRSPARSGVTEVMIWND